MTEEHHVTIRRRVLTDPVRFVQQGVAIPERVADGVTAVQQGVAIPERILTDPVRFVWQEYSFVQPFVTNFTIDRIGRTSAEFSYDTAESVACLIWARTEGPPLGAWSLKVYPGFHSTHTRHSNAPMPFDSWVHMYLALLTTVYTWEYWPTWPPMVYRYKTANAGGTGGEDYGIYLPT